MKNNNKKGLPQLIVTICLIVILVCLVFVALIPQAINNPLDLLPFIGCVIAGLCGVIIPIIAVFNYINANKKKETEKEVITAKTEDRLAHFIQESALPNKYPAFENRDDVDIFAVLKNKETLAGDCFDYFLIDDSHLAFYVAELTDKGVAAALLSTHINLCFKNACKSELSLAEILKRINLQLINDNISKTICSMCAGILNTATGDLTIADAGHCTPLIKRTTKFFELKLRKNVILGYSEASEYKMTEFKMKPGEELFIYSKGLIFGQKSNTCNLLNYANCLSYNNAQEFCNNILISANAKQSYDDDVCAMAIIFKKQRHVSITTEIKSFEFVDKYGGITLELTHRDLVKAGFDYSDLVTVEIDGKTQIIPMLPDYRFLTTGTTGLLSWPEVDRKCAICTFSGNFASDFNLTKDTTYPKKVFITLYEAKGYYAQYLLRNLNRTNSREDYPMLSEEEFANFRCCKTTGMGTDKLYRGSTPLDPEIGRNYITDNCLRKYNVQTILNMDNSKENAAKLPHFEKTYYSSVNHFELNMNANYEMPDTIKIIGDLFRIIANNKGPYFVHCFEGQDRTGFICAILEAFMGASLREIINDFMLTYYNYYGVEKGNMRYTSIVTNIIFELEAAFETEELANIDLKQSAYSYMKKVGLTDEEIQSLESNLR